MLTSDWHIHTERSCDEACLPLADLIDEAKARGVKNIGISDHLHSSVNIPDIRASRADLLARKALGHVRFGVEASVMSRWELDEIATGKHGKPVFGLRDGGPAGGKYALGLEAEDIAELGIEYVIGGAHWPMYVPWNFEAIVREYHLQQMFLAAHPLVTIVAHPWWWMSPAWPSHGQMFTNPWGRSFADIPSSMHDEFLSAAREYGKVIEINLEATLLLKNQSKTFLMQYLDYLSKIREAGLSLSLGSDCHSRHYSHDLDRPEELLSGAGIRDEDLWLLSPLPLFSAVVPESRTGLTM